ncbi:uncharacterized protein KY384_008162 [Bacidia gigantensis]|uniref:uncharacterized protein n=1 Tax=Bacidia gigantensis TaxID=2732470 RepID=UPI001D053898|nr:uncharacterized protein KY384_008162 [Bacidia gigantensis]KAG8526733.1 hypothetical protein KY384_008162 [Bacidia gigantensis]
MASHSLFPSFLDSSNSPVPNSATRLAPSPMNQQQPSNHINGNGASINGMPMSAGQQMDVNLLYQKVLELSDLLRENREKTSGIVAGAEELAVCTRAAANGASPSLQEANAEVASASSHLSQLFNYTKYQPIAARIADLERRLATEQHKVLILIQEQKENTSLIGEWENKVGELVEKVREHTFDNKSELNAQARHYNGLLQEEKDAHLQARIEKDEWHAKFMRAVAMMRESYRLRCEEEEVPLRVVSGLQNEVRALRSALGMESERVEEEYGWEILKDAPGGPGEV